MRKQLTAEVKELTERGEGVLRIATIGQADKDNDISLPGFYGRQYAALLPTHTWTHIPLGKGVISESGPDAVYQFKLNLEIEAAREWYSHLKFDLASPPSLQEVSYGFTLYPDAFERTQKDGQQVRYLKARPSGEPGCKIHEVSLVLVGAGLHTGVMDLKEYKDTLPHEILILDAKQEGFEIQTLIFPKDRWDSADDAQKWARDHDFRADSVDTTESSYRIRQHPPSDFERLRTICLAPNRDTAPEDCRVQAVGGPLKESRSEETGQVKLVEELDDIIVRVDHVLPKLSTLKQLREGEGRMLSKGRLEQMRVLIDRLTGLTERGESTEPDESADRAPVSGDRVGEVLKFLDARRTAVHK